MPQRPRGNRGGLPSSEYVYRSLREQIISGEKPPETRLVELTIASQFGVSRTPVREALKRLAAEGLVLVDPSRGMIVHAPDAAEIQDVFVIREALDGLAARLAAHRITPSELERLRLILESMAAAIAEDRREGVIVANERFHDVIYAAAGNARLERVSRELRELVHRYTTLPFASPERVEHLVEEHMAILKALQAHDPKRAEEAAASHLAAAGAYVEQIQLHEFAARLSARS
jgi:DNA-binding GntR family transcriptional regulator